MHRQLRLKDDSHHVSVMYACFRYCLNLLLSLFHCLNIMFCIIKCRAADPGFVKTNLMREYPKYVSAFAFLSFKLIGLLQTPDEGARSSVDATLAPPVKETL